jgi:NAD(P)-dependent dehydrogenase (short-subunit alcohol dehydrogenase family)
VNPEKPIGDVAGRTAVVVGASRGFGRGSVDAGV